MRLVSVVQFLLAISASSYSYTIISSFTRSRQSSIGIRAHPLASLDLASLSRKELQSYAKEFGVKANSRTEDIISDLKDLSVKLSSLDLARDASTAAKTERSVISAVSLDTRSSLEETLRDQGIDFTDLADLQKSIVGIQKEENSGSETPRKRKSTTAVVSSDRIASPPKKLSNREKKPVKASDSVIKPSSRALKIATRTDQHTGSEWSPGNIHSPNLIKQADLCPLFRANGVG